MREELQLMEAIERYLNNEMLPEEKAHFESLRASNPEIDQLVVEHSLFLKQLDQYGQRKDFIGQLHNIHQELENSGEIKTSPSRMKAVQMVNKYKRVLALAASIAGITALAISGLVTYLTPKTTPSEIAQLKKEINTVKISQKQTQNEINTLKLNPDKPASPGKFGGTGFLIDGRGFLVTSAHVVAQADSVYIVNTKGEYFKAKTLHVDEQTDIAILKITDQRFEPVKHLPYGIKRTRADLGEQIFTLGFPRTEIVYNEGYLSAKTGYKGDTVSYQIAISANPGNSGGPIFNHNGEVIGVLSGKQLTAEGVVFSSQSKNIFKALEVLKQDSSTSIKVPASSTVKGIDRVQQIKKIEECIYNVMSY
ncbi:MAG TPA: serine protease [Flavihumibacter sp.]|jgi:serine protease Do